MAEIPLRLIEFTGIKAIIGCYWIDVDNETYKQSNWDAKHYHRIEVVHGHYPGKDAVDWNGIGLAEEPPVSRFFGMKCMEPHNCGIVLSQEAWEAAKGDKDTFRIGHYTFNTASGDPEEGDVYRPPWFDKEQWPNEFCVQLPKRGLQHGHVWQSNQIASNCNHGEEARKKLHRCWEITGELPNITVRPSIMMDSGEGRQIHGFITNGKWVDC